MKTLFFLSSQLKLICLRNEGDSCLFVRMQLHICIAFLRWCMTMIRRRCYCTSVDCEQWEPIGLWISKLWRVWKSDHSLYRLRLDPMTQHNFPWPGPNNINVIIMEFRCCCYSTAKMWVARHTHGKHWDWAFQLFYGPDFGNGIFY